MTKKIPANLLVLLMIVSCLTIGSGMLQAQTQKAQPATKSDAKKTTQTAKKTDLIDLNSATKEQLMTLSGIGDINAQKIIDNRPYARKDELVQKNLIPKATYDKISSQIIAKQSAAGAKKGTTAAKKKS